MKYRALSPQDDYTFGSEASWLVDSPAAVAQAVETRLRLETNEWFLDRKEGLNWARILGFGTVSTRDSEVKKRILGTPGVRSLVNYSSSTVGRSFAVTATIDTIYGRTTVQGEFE